MKRKILREDLRRILQPQPGQESVSQQAAGKELSYVGFGRYKDPKSGHVTHISQNGKLVPFQGAVKTNTFQQTGTDDIGLYREFTSPEVQELHAFLVSQYTPDKYDDKQLDAIHALTSGGYVDLNNRLSSMPSGVPANKIEPQSVDDPIPDMVNSLDSAIKKSRAPADFLTYCNLGADVDQDLFYAGLKFTMRGFVTTCIEPTNVIRYADMSRVSPLTGRPQVLMLQILVKKNSRGLYLSDFSATPDDMEFLLPRDPEIKITGGPNEFVGSDANSQNLNLEVLYFEGTLLSY